MKGSELKRIRKRLGKTQQGMAKLLGVTRNTVARQERDAVSITEPMARLIRMVGAQHKQKAA